MLEREKGIYRATAANLVENLRSIAINIRFALDKLMVWKVIS